MAKKFIAVFLSMCMCLVSIMTIAAYATQPQDIIIDTDTLSEEEYRIWKENYVTEQKIQQEIMVSESLMLSASYVNNNYIRNDYLEAYVQSNGRYTIGTTGGNPNSTSDDNKKMLYGHPGSDTTKTTIRIDGSDSWFKATTAPITSEDGEYSICYYTNGDIQVKQTLSFVSNYNTGRDDVIEIKYEIVNNGSVSHEVGTRIMMDTMLGGNDSAPFKIDGYGDCTTETEFISGNIPQNWQVFDNLTNPTVISAGTFFRDISQMPDKVQFCNWGRIEDVYWDYTVTNGRSNGDSAVAIYFNPKTLAPGETRTVSTYYGLNDFAVQDLQPPLAVGVFAPMEVNVNTTGDGYIPNPITVTAHIENVGAATATGASIRINLSEGMSLSSGETTISIGDLPVGEKRQISWLVNIAGQSIEKVLNYSISAMATNAETKTLPLTLKVPAVNTITGDVLCSIIDPISYAGNYRSFTVEFAAIPTSAYLQFDVQSDPSQWYSEEYCSTHPLFKIDLSKIESINGKFVYNTEFRIHSEGLASNGYQRKVRVIANYSMTPVISTPVSFTVMPIPESDHSTIGYIYEQTSSPDESAIKPMINLVTYKTTSSGKIEISVVDYDCDNRAKPFFYWKAENGKFNKLSDNFTSVEYIPHGTGKVTVYMGDGLGYVASYELTIKY